MQNPAEFKDPSGLSSSSETSFFGGDATGIAVLSFLLGYIVSSGRFNLLGRGGNELIRHIGSVAYHRAREKLSSQRQIGSEAA